MRTEIEKWTDDNGKEHTDILHIVEFSDPPSRESIEAMEFRDRVVSILLTLLIEGGLIGLVTIVCWLLARN